MSDIQPAQELDPVHIKIEARAYEIWVHEGCQDGHDLDHWLRAEAEIASESTAPEATGEVTVTTKKK